LVSLYLLQSRVKVKYPDENNTGSSGVGSNSVLMLEVMLLAKEGSK